MGLLAGMVVEIRADFAVAKPGGGRALGVRTKYLPLALGILVTYKTLRVGFRPLLTYHAQSRMGI